MCSNWDLLRVNKGQIPIEKTNGLAVRLRPQSKGEKPLPNDVPKLSELLKLSKLFEPPKLVELLPNALPAISMCLSRIGTPEAELMDEVWLQPPKQSDKKENRSIRRSLKKTASP